MLTLTFEIRLEANYHVGAGYGQGFNLDSALLREADGTPVLRGSGLAGLLRDGAYRLLRLPPLAKHPPGETLVRLFGSPAQAKRWRISSARPVEKRPADAQIVWRVRVDPRTRRAEPQKLFSQEEGVAGQVFRFNATCPYDDAAALDEAALLVAAARNVRQLGRSRRRGLGECVIHLTGVSGVDEAQKPADQSWEEWFLGRFDWVWMQSKPTEDKNPPIKSDIQTVNLPRGAALRLRVIVRLDEPLLIARRASAGNQFDTHPFIPGSVLLGALANRAAERYDLADPKIYRDFVGLLLRGGVTYPVLYPAYPFRSHLYPTIPAPLGLVTCSVVPFQDQNEGHGAYQAWAQDKCPKCSPKYSSRLEPVGDFVILKRDSPYTFSPQRSSEMHIRMDERTQRAAKRDLYGYTLLSAGQYFVGELLCADEAVWQRLQEMTGIAEKRPLIWWLGKGRRRGYGQVTAWLERCDDHSQTWIQLSLEQRVSDPMQPITLTLLTDTIIANPWGQQAAGLSEEWLESALGLGPLKIHGVYAQTRVVDSFNATLGLPRWRDMAFVAGSTVRVSLKAPPVDWAMRMQRLEAEGIGLRRNEGFGRVAFNHPVYEQRQNIRESAISLDWQMRLSGGLGRDRFMDRWEEELEKHRSVLLRIKRQYEERFGSCFGALARWLHACNDVPPEELVVRLASMGDPEKAFGQPHKALVAAIGEREYGQRGKDNFYTKEAKDGIEVICKALEYLKEEEDTWHWRSGIQRLAEWIAELAGEKEGGVQ